MKWYRVLFQFKGKPLVGWNVSEKMPLVQAKHLVQQLKKSGCGYDFELVEIKENE